MTHYNDTHDAPQARPSNFREVPVAVQILGTLVFGGFAIAATAMAFAHFWPAGVALAVILAWRGGFVPQGSGGGSRSEATLETLCTLGAEATKRQTGNASFDAYRDDVLNRLEEERASFEGFLDRLRAARDASEFDQFMDARVQKVTTGRDAMDGPSPA